MPFFKRKKKKKLKQENDAKILADFLGTTQDITKEYLQNSSRAGEIEHYILDRCEQMIGKTKQLGVMKDEYYDVVGFLNDIQTVEELPKRQLEELKKIASNIIKIKEQQEEYVVGTHKLDNEQFARMREHEKEIPDIVLRMKENETYDAMVRRDMGYLEGEKQEWTETKAKLKREEKILKTLSMLLFGVFFLICIVLVALQFGFGTDVKIPFLATVCAGALAGFSILMRLQNGRRDYKLADKNLNYAIALLNKVKIKYVNTTNALDYTSEKFGVKNSYELEYQWEQYMETLREQENLNRLKEELEYNKRELRSKMDRALLNHIESWCDKPELFLDKQEQLLLKQELYNREEKIRSQIENNAKQIREAKSEVERLLSKQPEVAPEIKEILESINELLRKGNWD
ncbi:MAG: hypothetical protein HFG80_12095 [Eubacterium sp.]|nr:hypothetical protein [Eubacterium sp.]